MRSFQAASRGLVNRSVSSVAERRRASSESEVLWDEPSNCSNCSTVKCLAAT